MVKRQSDSYWDKRAIERIDRSEKAIEPRLAELDRIYAKAQAQITVEINKIYATYGKQQGLDIDALTKKLSVEETHAFWLQMKKDGNLAYITSNYQSRISRLEQIKGQIYSQVRQIANDENDTHTTAHTETINTAYNGTAYDLAVGLNANIPFGGINQQVLDTMLNQKWLGENYSNRIWKNTDLLATTIKDQLGAALLTGQSSKKLTDGLVEEFGVSRAAAKRLLRTETNYFQNEANAESTMSLGLDRYKYLATLDTRTSLTCRLHDDKIYLYKNRVVGTNYPPLHPNCRSTTRAYIGEEYEPTQRRAKGADGKPVLIENMSYTQWAKMNEITITTPTKAPTPTPPTGLKPKAGKPTMAGVQAGKPMAPEKAVLANPNYDKGREWQTNCQKTVPTYELRRRGYDVTALPRDANSNAIATNLGIPKIWGKTEMDYRSYAKEIRRPDGSTFLIRQRTIKSEMVKHLQTYPVGARIQMTYAYTKRRSGHTIMVEVVEKSDAYPKGFMFVDPQTQKISSGINLTGKTRFALIRVDNRPIEAGLVDTIAKENKA